MQIQALDRNADLIPPRPGLPERHRSREFISVLNYLQARLADQEVHLIMDNYCTHKSAEVQRWLQAGAFVWKVSGDVIPDKVRRFRELCRTGD